MSNKKRVVISILFVFFIFGVSLPLFISNHKKVKAETITSLVGYTWVGNTTLSLPSSETTYDIDFTNQNYNYYMLWLKAYGDNQVLYARQNNPDTLVYDREYGSGWESNDYKTIVITGGNDVSNTNLITWLSNNGTLTAPAPTGTEITHKYWALGSVITMPNNAEYRDNDIEYTILFNEQKRQYDETNQTGLIFKGKTTNDQRIYIESINGSGINLLYMNDSDNNYINNVMWLEFNVGDYMDTYLYDFMDTWGLWFDDAEIYLAGMDQGYVEGKEVGIGIGEGQGIQFTSLITNIFNGLGNLLNIEIFPNITIGLIIGLPLLLGVFIIIIKILRG